MGIFGDNKGNPRWSRIILVPVILIVIVGSLLSTFITVPAGHRGVVIELGAVKERVLNEGFHTITPFVQSVQNMEVRTLKYEVPASAATKDLLDVAIIVAVNFHISESAVNEIYQKVGMDYENRIISPAVQEVVKATTAKFDAEELITKRPIVAQQIEQTLRERLQPRDIVVETVAIVNFEFPRQFNEAIISKQTAIQLKQKAENDLERIRVEAEQQVARARGEAQSIEIINLQLQKSPQYIQLIATQKWDGKLPLATGGVLPFIQIPTGTNKTE